MRDGDNDDEVDANLESSLAVRERESDVTLHSAAYLRSIAPFPCSLPSYLLLNRIKLAMAIRHDISALVFTIGLLIMLKYPSRSSSFSSGLSYSLSRYRPRSRSSYL